MIGIDLFVKQGCVSCQRALDLLRLTGLPVRTRDLLADRLSWEEIKWLAGLAGGLRHIISTQSRGYRLNHLARADIAEAELIRQMAADPELIRRPIVMVDGIVLVGFEDLAAGIP